MHNTGNYQHYKQSTENRIAGMSKGQKQQLFLIFGPPSWLLGKLLSVHM